MPHLPNYYSGLVNVRQGWWGRVSEVAGCEAVATDDQIASGRLRLTAAAWPGSTPAMDAPEETRELPDVTIRAQETSPGFFVASYHPTSPETHPARQGFSIDTKRGLRGKNLAKVLDFAEAYWRQNYPDT
jgi:hypothetical protein